MSRATKGFADFFPTAPSVLQQKRSRAARDKRKQRSPPTDHLDVIPSASGAVEEALVEDGDSDVGPTINGTNGYDSMAEPQQLPDDADLAMGDIHGVGSASSSSTTSSIFSVHRTLGVTHHGGNHQPITLTPLTNTDSSPPGLNKSPSNSKSDVTLSTDIGPSSRTPDSHHMAPTPEALTPISSPRLMYCQARPGRGEVKGFKVIYDPELDKKLSSKEKKGRKIQYKPFGENVCYIKTPHPLVFLCYGKHQADISLSIGYRYSS